jgi:hypothetical protein
VRAGSIAVGAARHGLQTAIEALLIIAIIVTLAFAGALVTGAASPGGAGSVLAAKGGNGGGGKPSGTSATLVVTPDPVAAGGAVYTVTGSGYPPGQLVPIALGNPGCCVSFNVLADSAGNIRFERTTGFAGTYSIKAYKVGRKVTLFAQTTFVVQ